MLLHEFSPLLRWSLVAVTAVALAISLGRLGRHRPTTATAGLTSTGCEADAGHALMLTSMLVMFAAPGGLVPVGTWRALFTVAVICYGALLVGHTVRWRAQPVVERRIDGIFSAGHHLVMAAAMLYMTFTSGPVAATPNAHHAGLPLPGIAWALVVVLTIDAVRQILAAATLQAPGRTATKLPPSIRIALVPPTVMDATMAIMLAAML
jgi:hypothetical protein